MNTFASNMFKGRIGEAIVESVLLEFGYRVERTGQEYRGKSGNQRFAPDLLVINPKTAGRRHVEVKLRSARPMSPLIESIRLEKLHRYYPETVLVFVSAYNGSVNCTEVSSVLACRSNLLPDECYEFDLFDDSWKPIWHFFPLVEPGKRLSNLWATLKQHIHSFAESRVLSYKEKELFEDEREMLVDYIESKQDVRMLLSGAPTLQAPISESQIDEISLEQLWEKALDMNAFLFAMELCGEENVNTLEFIQVTDRVRGRRGERYISMDFEEIEEMLRPYPNVLTQFRDLRNSIYRSTLSDSGPAVLKKLCDLLPPGIGRVLLSVENAPWREGVEIDLRTALAMAQHRNRLDADE